MNESISFLNNFHFVLYEEEIFMTLVDSLPFYCLKTELIALSLLHGNNYLFPCTSFGQTKLNEKNIISSMNSREAKTVKIY